MNDGGDRLRRRRTRFLRRHLRRSAGGTTPRAGARVAPSGLAARFTLALARLAAAGRAPAIPCPNTDHMTTRERQRDGENDDTAVLRAVYMLMCLEQRRADFTGGGDET